MTAAISYRCLEALLPPMRDYEDHVVEVASLAADLAVAASRGAPVVEARLGVMRALWNAMAERRNEDPTPGDDLVARRALYPLFRYEQWLDADDLGFVYETVQASDRAKRGAYYSPQSITKRVVSEALRPHLPRLMSTEDVRGFRIHDPACGGGAMLVEAARQLADHLLSRVWIRESGAVPSDADPDGCLHCKALHTRLSPRIDRLKETEVQDAVASLIEQARAIECRKPSKKRAPRKRETPKGGDGG